MSLSVLDPSATDTSVAKEGEEKSEELPKEETKPEEGEETKEVKGRQRGSDLVALSGFIVLALLLPSLTWMTC